jgi:hypothetical protein
MDNARWPMPAENQGKLIGAPSGGTKLTLPTVEGGIGHWSCARKRAKVLLPLTFFFCHATLMVTFRAGSYAVTLYPSAIANRCFIS